MTHDPRALSEAEMDKRVGQILEWMDKHDWSSPHSGMEWATTLRKAYRAKCEEVEQAKERCLQSSYKYADLQTLEYQAKVARDAALAEVEESEYHTAALQAQLAEARAECERIRATVKSIHPELRKRLAEEETAHLKALAQLDEKEADLATARDECDEWKATAMNRSTELVACRDELARFKQLNELLGEQRRKAYALKDAMYNQWTMEEAENNKAQDDLAAALARGKEMEEKYARLEKAFEEASSRYTAELGRMVEKQGLIGMWEQRDKALERIKKLEEAAWRVVGSLPHPWHTGELRKLLLEEETPPLASLPGGPEIIDLLCDEKATPPAEPARGAGEEE